MIWGSGVGLCSPEAELEIGILVRVILGGGPAGEGGRGAR